MVKAMISHGREAGKLCGCQGATSKCPLTNRRDPRWDGDGREGRAHEATESEGVREATGQCGVDEGGAGVEGAVVDLRQ